MFDSNEWELTWPRDLFVDEANELLTRRVGNVEISLLLEEAFAESDAAQVLQREPWSPTPDAEEILRQLVAVADRLREATEPRPYFSQRRSGTGVPALSRETARRGFVGLIGELDGRGYLDRAFPKICVDDNDSVPVDPSSVLEDRLGRPGLWPLRHSKTWDDETFYDLTEVFHDLVARPRSRSWHSWDQCGWHWSNFAREPGQALYRWRVNRLLERSNVPYRLADSGEDCGRLVTYVGDAREKLIERAVESPDPLTRDPVRHAVALFRSRDATDHDRRSAVIALAGILEQRRQLLRAELYSKDEGALFQIANEFSIRHQNEGQKRDYDPVFLDWVFWWYLATVELTDRLLARDEP